jgi:hypothetical protein
MIEVTVAHLGLDRSTNAPVVILREKGGARILPIWIGPAEASAIAMEMQGMKAPRPMTHDLLKQVVTGLGAELRRLVIADVRDNTYYAELHLARGGDDRFLIDSRPSDGIALALRLRAPGADPRHRFRAIAALSRDARSGGFWQVQSLGRCGAGALGRWVSSSPWSVVQRRSASTPKRRRASPARSSAS